MKMRRLLLALFLGLMIGGSAGARGEDFTLTVSYSHARQLYVRVGVFTPESGGVTGDVLYFHGFADSYQNHLPLFRQWTSSGLRVIAFDLPGHGDTRGDKRLASINAFNFSDLMDLAARVESATRQDPQRPLIFAGWSTGATLLIRLVQGENYRRLGRVPRGAILFAPGVPVKPVIGRPSLHYPVGEVTLDTLTHATAEAPARPISPRSPGLVPLFAASLFTNSLLAEAERYPAWLPTLVFVAGDSEDKYVCSRATRRWANKQSASLVGVQCPLARHWLDREPAELGGEDVVAFARDFAAAAAAGEAENAAFQGNHCQRFK